MIIPQPELIATLGGRELNRGVLPPGQQVIGRGAGVRIRLLGSDRVSRHHALFTIFLIACDAIADAHSKGVVHRDLKLENLMLGDFGEVLVMDWGMAKPLGRDANTQPTDSSIRQMVDSPRHSDPSASDTLPGEALGTIQLMSPEQASGNSRDVDARADIDALGAILYNTLTPPPTRRWCRRTGDAHQRRHRPNHPNQTKRSSAIPSRIFPTANCPRSW